MPEIMRFALVELFLHVRAHGRKAVSRSVVKDRQIPLVPPLF
jgi:hypothetical protein